MKKAKRKMIGALGRGHSRGNGAQEQQQNTDSKHTPTLEAHFTPTASHARHHGRRSPCFSITFSRFSEVPMIRPSISIVLSTSSSILALLESTNTMNPSITIVLFCIAQDLRLKTTSKRMSEKTTLSFRGNNGTMSCQRVRPRDGQARNSDSSISPAVKIPNSLGWYCVWDKRT